MGETKDTGEDKQPEKLSEDEQKAVALDWFIAMWNEAIKRGVGEDILCIMSLSATTSKLAEHFGDSQTAELLKSVRKSVLKGQFTPSPESAPAENEDA